MRSVVIAFLVAALMTPAFARPHKRAHHKKAPPPKHAVHIIPNDQQARDHDKAEAELADLRAGKVDTGSESGSESEAVPDIAGVTQENDAERPPLQARGQR